MGGNKMIYIVDTNIFSLIFKNMKPRSVFEKLIYEPLETLMKQGKVISVDEVYEELSGAFSNKEADWDWFKAHKDSFGYLSNEECKTLMEIFKNKKFREGVKEKSIRIGSPEADAMIIAKAKALNGLVVTNEASDKPNAEKLPNMCVAFNLKFIKLEEFYQVLSNVSLGKDELEGVSVRETLDE